MRSSQITIISGRTSVASITGRETVPPADVSLYPLHVQGPGSLPSWTVIRIVTTLLTFLLSKLFFDESGAAGCLICFLEKVGWSGHNMYYKNEAKIPWQLSSRLCHQKSWCDFEKECVFWPVSSLLSVAHSWDLVLLLFQSPDVWDYVVHGLKVVKKGCSLNVHRYKQGVRDLQYVSYGVNWG